MPFYLRTGKRMARKVAEIVIDFATIPYPIFRSAARYPVQNRLVIRLQPRDEVML